MAKYDPGKLATRGASIMQQKLEMTILPFYELAKEVLLNNGNSSKPDTIIVYGVNNKHITIGDCRKIIKLFENN
jgi:hypothetical protein